MVDLLNKHSLTQNTQFRVSLTELLVCLFPGVGLDQSVISKYLLRKLCF